MEVNVIQAKTDFSKLLRLLESKKEDSIIVSRYGKPVAKITPYDVPAVSNRLGIADGKYGPINLDDFDSDNEEIARLLIEGEL